MAREGGRECECARRVVSEWVSGCVRRRMVREGARVKLAKEMLFYTEIDDYSNGGVKMKCQCISKHSKFGR